MKNKIKQFIDTKQFHICMFFLIIFIILFVVGIVVLKYNVEGEQNLPFYLSKISVISNVEGEDIEDTENKWNLVVNENNDIYLYIKKNDSYNQSETIKSIVLDNFNVTKFPNVGELKLLKPDGNIENVIFKDNIENEVSKIEYIGDMDSSIKDLKISNQGGLVVFRYAITNIGNYVSNDDEEISHIDLLKNITINNDDLKFNVSFDIIIELDSGKKFKANTNLELPIKDVVNDGIQSEEYTDLNDIVFKRVKNT